MKRFVLACAMLVPLCVNAAQINCNKDHVNYYTDIQNDKVVWCKNGNKPCYTPAKVFELCKYNHKQFDAELKAFIDFETKVLQSSADVMKKRRAEIAEMEKAIAAKKAAEAKRAKEEAEKPMLDKTLGVLKSVFGG